MSDIGALLDGFDNKNAVTYLDGLHERVASSSKRQASGAESKQR